MAVIGNNCSSTLKCVSLVSDFRLFDQHPEAMIRLRVTLTLCLLCFLAASLAEDAGSEREVREANDDFSTAAKTYNNVLVRQKRDCE